MALTSKVFSGLCGQYKNIDIRAIDVRNQSNPQWYCAFLKIYFTNDIKDAIEDIIGILNLPHTSRYGASIGFKTYCLDSNTL
jgi:hypothetical protein